MGKLATVRSFLKELFQAWGASRSPQAAAALAYFGMFSFAPALYFALTVAGIFLDELSATNELITRLENTFGQETTQFILETVDKVSQTILGRTPLTSLIGLIALLFAASGLFAQLEYSLNMIWRVPPPEQRGIIAVIRNRLLAFVMVIALGLLLALMTVVSVVLSVFGDLFNLGSSMPIGNFVSVMGLATVTFALIYKVLPDADVAWRDVWLGALVTAVLFGVARWVLAFYLAHANVGSAFDAAGALAVILIAIYYLALIFLFGAVFTSVYASLFGSKAGSTPE